jgi:catechol 2,3-dioxygenase-like lactoylglutathione lyase family enzyme
MQNSVIDSISEIEISVEDIKISQNFLVDLGLTRKTDETFSTLDGSIIKIFRGNECSVKTITWNLKIGLEDFYQKFKNDLELIDKIGENNTIECRDPSGMLLVFKTDKKINVAGSAIPVNGWNSINRIDKIAPVHDIVNPIEISHIVLETDNINNSENFYKKLGFIVSDRIIGRGVFLRSAERNGHHDLFLIESDKNKIHHVAFAVRDIYELFSGGKIMESKGWQTAKGPGQHSISSAFFWYFESPLGFMVEYTVNEDYLTENWKAREFKSPPDITSESFVQR